MDSWSDRWVADPGVMAEGRRARNNSGALHSTLYTSRILAGGFMYAFLSIIFLGIRVIAQSTVIHLLSSNRMESAGRVT